MDIEELRQRCQGEKLRANTGATLWNRRVSIRFTRVLIRLEVSANQATWGSIFFGIAGSALFLPGAPWLNIAGAGLLYISLVLDQVDGELARYYRTVSLNGVYLDEIRHLLVYSVTIFCLSVPLQAEYPFLFPQLAGFAGALATIVNRIEQRIPMLIFTDRVLLHNNFTGGNPGSTAAGARADRLREVPDSGARGLSLKGGVARMLYQSFELINDQVLIIALLVLVTLLDGASRQWPCPWSGGGMFFQAVFLYYFAVTGVLVVSRTIVSHWREGWTEVECAKVASLKMQIARPSEASPGKEELNTSVSPAGLDQASPCP